MAVAVESSGGAVQVEARLRLEVVANDGGMAQEIELFALD